MTLGRTWSECHDHVFVGSIWGWGRTVRLQKARSNISTAHYSGPFDFLQWQCKQTYIWGTQLLLQITGPACLRTQWNLLTLCPMRCRRRIGSVMFTVQVNLSQRTPWSYVENEDIALRILNLGFRWEWTVIFTALPRITSPRYLMYRSLGRHQSLLWRLWRIEDLAYAGNQTADPRSSSP